MPQDITNLTGVGVAAMAVWLFYKMSSNHVEHNTRALNELIEVIRELKEWLQNHHVSHQ